MAQSKYIPSIGFASQHPTPNNEVQDLQKNPVMVSLSLVAHPFQFSHYQNLAKYGLHTHRTHFLAKGCIDNSLENVLLENTITHKSAVWVFLVAPWPTLVHMLKSLSLLYPSYGRKQSPVWLLAGKCSKSRVYHHKSSVLSRNTWEMAQSAKDLPRSMRTPVQSPGPMEIVIPVLERWKQADSWGLIGKPGSPNQWAQASERLCLKEQWRHCLWENGYYIYVTPPLQYHISMLWSFPWTSDTYKILSLLVACGLICALFFSVLTQNFNNAFLRNIISLLRGLILGSENTRAFSSLE